MHDTAIANGIIDAVKGYRNLRSVVVLVGRDSCLTAGMLTHSFELAKPGTPAENARLVVVPGPGSAVSVLSVEVSRDETQ